MANINLKQGGSAAGLGMCATATPGIVSVRVTGAQAAAAKGSALAAADIIYVADIPAHTMVRGVTLAVKTADTGTTLTFDLGDAGSADEFVDGADGTTAGYYVQGTNGLFDVAKLYAAADVIDLTVKTIGSANDDWEVEILFEVADYTGNPRAKSAKDVA